MSPHSPSGPSQPSRKQPLHLHQSLASVVSFAVGTVLLFCLLAQRTLAKSSEKHSAAHLAGRVTPGQTVNPDFWHTEGSRIVNATGQTVRISGVNWSGFETPNMAPGGLKVRDYHSILRGIRAAGYNTVRIPFSNQMVESPIVPAEIRFEDTTGAPINYDLIGLNAMQVLDRIVDSAGQAGLKVILDNHRSEAGSSAAANGLWYTDQYPESAWIADWTALAARYRQNPAVLGFDLRNEPHNATHGGACWSCGGATDWHLAAERAGDAVLHANPNLLIFVEGTDTVGTESDFWGGNLSGVRSAPVHLAIAGRLVYSAHVYGPTEYQQSWFNASTTASLLAAMYHRHWGYISESGMAPVWIGEFGAPNNDADVSSTEPGSEGQWFQALITYLASHPDIGWTYWGINGEDRYGLLDVNYDTTPLNHRKAEALASIRLPQSPGIAEPAEAPAKYKTVLSYNSPQPYSVSSAAAETTIHAAQHPARTRVAASAVTSDEVIRSTVAEQVRLATERALRSSERPAD